MLTSLKYTQPKSPSSRFPGVYASVQWDSKSKSTGGANNTSITLYTKRRHPKRHSSWGSLRSVRSLRHNILRNILKSRLTFCSKIFTVGFAPQFLLTLATVVTNSTFAPLLLGHAHPGTTLGHALPVVWRSSVTSPTSSQSSATSYAC